MTSDHRVAGSSPAGCKSHNHSGLADNSASLKTRSKSAVIGLLSGFLILLASVAAYVRTTACIFACPVSRQVHNSGLVFEQRERLTMPSALLDR